jgi:hypothetical protein
LHLLLHLPFLFLGNGGFLFSFPVYLEKKIDCQGGKDEQDNEENGFGGKGFFSVRHDWSLGRCAIFGVKFNENRTSAWLGRMIFVMLQCISVSLSRQTEKRILPLS